MGEINGITSDFLNMIRRINSIIYITDVHSLRNLGVVQEQHYDGSVAGGNGLAEGRVTGSDEKGQRSLLAQLLAAQGKQKQAPQSHHFVTPPQI